MLRQISKVTSKLGSQLGGEKAKKKSNKKMVEQIDWRPEGQAKRNRSKSLSKLHR